MSRVGKRPVEIPSGVDVKLMGDTIAVKGPLGQLSSVCRGDHRIIATVQYEHRSVEIADGADRVEGVAYKGSDQSMATGHPADTREG